MARKLDALLSGLSPARTGAGRYLERDYWTVIRECRCSPDELMLSLRERFCEFSPPELAEFRRAGSEQRPLEEGDELQVKIAMAGTFGVRVVHCTPQTLTLATLRGHPEAGRITFGAYRNPHRDVIFHIRSRARSGSRAMYVGFFAAGEAMQTNTWTDFVAAVAHTFGSGVIGYIHAETRAIDLESEDENLACSPTFLAEG